MKKCLLKLLPAISLGLLLLGLLQFPALARQPEGSTYYQGSGEVYVQAGDWPSIHHDASNSGVLPEGLAAPRQFRLRWSALQNASVLSSPVAGDDGRVYVTATQENFEPIEDWESGVLQSQLYAVDAVTGEVIWARGEIMFGGMAGAPLLIRSPQGELSIVVTGAGAMIAYDENGGIRWRSDIGRQEIGISAHLSPDGRSIFLGTDKGSVYLKDPATGADLIPAYKDPDLFNGNTPAMTADGTVIMVGNRSDDPADGLAWAVRPRLDSGSWETVWVFEDIEGKSETSPTISQDGSRVYIGDEDAAMIALDVRSGEEIWRYDFSDVTGSRYLVYASIPVTADGLLGINLIQKAFYTDSRIVRFLDRYWFPLNRLILEPVGLSLIMFDWSIQPRYVAILRDVGDHAELEYFEDWKVNGGLTYSAGSGLFYFAGMERDPVTGKMENIVVGLDYETGEAFTQPIENPYLNNISLANGALIVPIFWGGELDSPMVTFEGYGLHYYENTP